MLREPELIARPIRPLLQYQGRTHYKLTGQLLISHLLPRLFIICQFYLRYEFYMFMLIHNQNSPNLCRFPHPHRRCLVNYGTTRYVYG